MSTTLRDWYGFAKNVAHATQQEVALVGGKGAGLAHMCRLGLPVPPGFTLPTTWCLSQATQEQPLPAVVKALDDGLGFLREHGAGELGDTKQPLLVSVRSGARTSMPGMMETIINIGTNWDIVETLCERGGERTFALDVFRRLIEGYACVVYGVSYDMFRERALEFEKEESATQREKLVREYLVSYEETVGQPFEFEPRKQLHQAVVAVFRSWNTKRAQAYRRMHHIPNDWGTAANVQSMVFGSLGEICGTGVMFSRNPATGEPSLFGEWLPRAQGEDIVAGVRTPQPMRGEDPASLEQTYPKLYQQALQAACTLENSYGDMQDIEFTIEDGTFYVLQTRTGKRTAPAALRIAMDMVAEKRIDQDDALLRVHPDQVDALLHPVIDPNSDAQPVATGLAASPGAAVGTVVFDADDAVAQSKQGNDVILVRRETSADDVHGIKAAAGVLTATGGMTSHAAVVARGMGRVCITGCDGLHVQEDEQACLLGEQRIARGDVLTLDGTTGRVFVGEVSRVRGESDEDLQRLLEWADKRRRLGVRANADNAEDASRALERGAEGIGLCRTEHMFFAPERLVHMRRVILAKSSEEEAKALAALERFQTEDFAAMFRVMHQRPVTIRLLDPPLHEFLPNPEEAATVAEGMGVSKKELLERAQQLGERNPMLGLRGVRLGITRPSIYAMQVRAMVRAACRVADESGVPRLEIMIPFLIEARELERVAAVIAQEASAVMDEEKRQVMYQVGTMIEIPRAALVADAIAQTAEFFSFGTNDLTQTTLGLSRDDAGTFLGEYVDAGILPTDPFRSVVPQGVAELVRIAVERGKSVRASMETGVCGEHGGDPESIAIFDDIGVDYVSCSPFRLPVARLAAAQSAIRRDADASSGHMG